MNYDNQQITVCGNESGDIADSPWDEVYSSFDTILSFGLFSDYDAAIGMEVEEAYNELRLG